MQSGDYVQSGQRLASLVPLDHVYVDANFKETQLADLHPGQPVSIAVDALDGHAIAGTVESVAPASGSVFSLLPPDNATGNFTKVVQRIPVRIRVPAKVGAEEVLRPGMSVVVSVDTKPGAKNAARHDGHRLQVSVSHGGCSRIIGRQWRRGCRSHRSAPPVRVPDHGVRDVHGHPRHPDRLRLAHRDPGRACRLEQRDHLGADGLPHRRGGDDPALGLSVAGARHAHAVRHRRRRLCRREPDVRPVDDHQRDDRLARHPGLHRRRHDPHRVRLGLPYLSALAHGTDRAADRPRRHPGADDRADGRRLFDRCVVVALAVLHQRRARHPGHHRGADADRLRPAGLFAVRELRLRRPLVDGRFPRCARIRAGGRPAQRLVR